MLSTLCCCQQCGEHSLVEVRISEIAHDGEAILEVMLPQGVFADKKETMDGVYALFPTNARPRFELASVTAGLLETGSKSTE